jgi:hypothetical protein
MCYIVTDKLANLTNSTDFFYFYYTCQRLYNAKYNKQERVIITKYIKNIARLFHDITSENESSILSHMQHVRDLIQSELLSIHSEITVRELLYNDNKEYVRVHGGGNWTKEELDNYF